MVIKRVPVIGSGHRNSIDRFLVEHAANVLRGRRLSASQLLDVLQSLPVRPRVWIDQVSDLNARHLAELADVRTTASIQTRDCQTNGVIGPNVPGPTTWFH